MAIKYISLDAALDFHIPTCDLNISAQDERAIGDRFEEFLKNIPAADVRPVVHGTWEHLNWGFDYNRCSVCGYEHRWSGPFYFCPQCGADMRR